MKDIGCFAKIYIAVEHADFRKQAMGLMSLVKNSLGCDTFNSKYLFVFSNRSRKSVRMVYWDRTGIAMWSKNLEKESYKWPVKKSGQQIEVMAKDLRMLLEGIDISKIKKHEDAVFSRIS